MKNKRIRKFFGTVRNVFRNANLLLASAILGGVIPSYGFDSLYKKYSNNKKEFIEKIVALVEKYIREKRPDALSQSKRPIIANSSDIISDLIDQKIPAKEAIDTTNENIAFFYPSIKTVYLNISKLFNEDKYVAIKDKSQYTGEMQKIVGYIESYGKEETTKRFGEQKTNEALKVQEIENERQRIFFIVAQTVAHEIIHTYGDYSDEDGNRLNLLDEGVPDLIASRIIEDLFKKEYPAQAITLSKFVDERGVEKIERALTEPHYEDYAIFAAELEKIVGRDILEESYFTKSTEKLRDAWNKKMGDVVKFEEFYPYFIARDEKNKLSGKINGETALKFLRRKIEERRRKKKNVSYVEEEEEPSQEQPMAKTHPESKYLREGEKSQPRTEGGRTHNLKGISAERYYSQCKKELAELNFRNPESTKRAEHALWNFMAIFYQNYLGRIPHLKVPRVVVLRNNEFLEKAGTRKDDIYGCYIADENIIYFNYDKIKDLDQNRKILLFTHETTHSFFFLNKTDFGFEDKFMHTLSEAATNVIAGELFSTIFPNIEVDTEYENFLELGEKVANGVGKERLYEWYFGNDPKSLFRGINRRYGFGADTILRAASLQTDAPTTLTFAVLNNLERAEDRTLPRIKIPRRGFEVKKFIGEFGKKPVKAIYNSLSGSLPHINPYERAMLAGDIAYRSFADADSRKPVESAVDMLHTADSLSSRSEVIQLQWATTYDLYEQIRCSDAIAPSISTQGIMEEIILKRLLSNSPVSADTIIPVMSDLSEEVTKYHSDDETQHGVTLSNLRKDIMRDAFSTGCEIKGEVVEIIPSVDNSFDDQGNYVSREPIVMMIGNRPIPIPVPSTFTDEDIENIPYVFPPIYEYLRGSDETVLVPTHYLAPFILTSYDLFASTYSAAEIIAGREFGPEGSRLVQSLFIAPDITSIQLMYEIAALAKECVPARSHTYSKVVS